VSCFSSSNISGVKKKSEKQTLKRRAKLDSPRKSDAQVKSNDNGISQIMILKKTNLQTNKTNMKFIRAFGGP
jgi:hypothetical protein